MKKINTFIKRLTILSEFEIHKLENYDKLSSESRLILGSILADLNDGLFELEQNIENEKNNKRRIVKWIPKRFQI